MLGLPYTFYMIMKCENLSSGLEDYLEAVYSAKLDDTPLKGAQLARILNISRASVSEALAKLVEKKLIMYNRYEFISLTDKGLKEAKRVYEKHHVLKDFFETVLGITPDEAGENACKIEHIVSENILNKMRTFSNFYKKHKKILDLYIEESEQ